MLKFPCIQSTIKVEESLPKPSVLLSSGYDKLYPKEEEKVLYSATSKDLESLYSPLGEPDLRDLPSFAYQIAQGMVCTANCDAQCRFVNKCIVQSRSFMQCYAICTGLFSDN